MLEPVKGLDVFLRAAARVAATRPDVRFVVNGTGSQRGELQALAAGLGLSERVTFPGHVPAGEALAGLSVFALPSYMETSGIALMEAMAAGVPSVATEVGGVPETAAGGAAELVAPGDAGALGAAIGRILDDPAFADALAARGRDAVARAGGPPETARRILALYESARERRACGVLIAIAEMRTGGAERVVVTLARGLADGGTRVGVAAAHGELDPELGTAKRFAFTDRGRSPLGLAAGALAVARGVRALSRRRRARPQRPRQRVRAGRGAARPARAPPSRPQHLPRGRPRRGRTGGADPRPFGRDHVRLGRPRRALALDGRRAFPAQRRRQRRGAGAGRDGRGARRIGRRARPRGRPGHRRRLPARARQGAAPPAEALPRVRAAVPGTRLVVVGDGPERAELEALAERLGLGNGVIFTGMRTDARRILSLAQVLAVSSASEGQPLAALRRSPRGPVVSTPVSGMRDLLAGGAGVVVDRADDLAAGLIAVLSNPAGAARMGATGRAVVAERHSAAAMLTAYGALYERI